MGNFDFLDHLKDENLLNFKKCVRKLLDSTFIVSEKDPVLYDYLTYSSNRIDMSNYLKIIGYDLVVDEELKYAMLIQNEEDMETAGLKKINHVNFSNKEVLVLIILWMLFLERFGKFEKVYVEFGDIIDRQKQYGIIMGSLTELKTALQRFKRFSLIYYTDTDFKENTIIHLYPTLQFAMDKNQFIQIVNEMAPQLNHNEETFDSQEERQ
ncbi:DUF4194 domain-containing protein [uncultured Dubosiella sp.]|uniref:DUF4194 domain-containing protein n=1 Tax=uncultured Dubosiella sp. TaxID=1937011 RepID=UPI0025965E16|nr:DUF4194 domain-containing protein [uncultured Dubosiella sp.]